MLSIATLAFSLPLICTATEEQGVSQPGPSVLNALQLESYSENSSVELQTVIQDNYSTLKYIAPEKRAELLEQGKTYLRFQGRASPKMNSTQRGEYVKKCETEVAQNPFCHYEIFLEPSDQQVSTVTPTPEISEGATEIRSTLKNLSRLESFDTFRPQAEQWLQASRCLSPAIYTAAGLKAEEFFPDLPARTLSEALFEKAIACKGNALVPQARFRLALLNLWKQNCAPIESILSPIQRGPESEPFVLRAKYWRYRCALKESRPKEAQALKEEIKREFPLSFYNLLISDRSEYHSNPTGVSSKQTWLKLRSSERKDLNLPVQALETLMHLGDKTLATRVALTLLRESANAEMSFRMYLSALLYRLRLGLQNFSFIAKNIREDSSWIAEGVLKLFFPNWFRSEVEQTVRGLDPYFVFSLVRQESAFNPTAESAAGATGLMQVMPSTAKVFERKSTRVWRRELKIPRVNLRIGTNYLVRRLRQYDGEVELTLAAYNAGAGRVTEWLRRYPVDDRLLFIDLIPFRETREYVTSILRNYFWYILLYSDENFRDRVQNQKNSLKLKLKSLESLDEFKNKKETGAP